MALPSGARKESGRSGRAFPSADFMIIQQKKHRCPQSTNTPSAAHPSLAARFPEITRAATAVARCSARSAPRVPPPARAATPGQSAAPVELLRGSGRGRRGRGSPLARRHQQPSAHPAPYLGSAGPEGAGSPTSAPLLGPGPAELPAALRGAGAGPAPAPAPAPAQQPPPARRAPRSRCREVRGAGSAHRTKQIPQIARERGARGSAGAILQTLGWKRPERREGGAEGERVVSAASSARSPGCPGAASPALSRGPAPRGGSGCPTGAPCTARVGGSGPALSPRGRPGLHGASCHGGWWVFGARRVIPSACVSEG